MKNVVLFIIFGIIGGILGGMGMGGGTLLIPLLVEGTEVTQKVAQLYNLVAFIPMSLLALIIHIKNKLIVKNDIFFVIIPAIFFAILGSFFVSEMPEDLLKKIFGGFLILMGFLYFSFTVFTKKNKN